MRKKKKKKVEKMHKCDCGAEFEATMPNIRQHILIECPLTRRGR